MRLKLGDNLFCPRSCLKHLEGLKPFKLSFITDYMFFIKHTEPQVLVSRAWLFATLWTVGRQAPLSMEFFIKNAAVGNHSLLQGNLPNPGIECRFPALAGGFFTNWATRKTHNHKVRKEGCHKKGIDGISKDRKTYARMKVIGNPLWTGTTSSAIYLIRV